jgi:hypothetical protein
MFKRILIVFVCISINLFSMHENIQDLFAKNNDLSIALSIYWQLEHNKACETIKVIENKQVISRRLEQADISDNLVSFVHKNKIECKIRLESALYQPYKVLIVKNPSHR